MLEQEGQQAAEQATDLLPNTLKAVEKPLVVNIDSLRRIPREGYLEACFGLPPIPNSMLDDLRVGYYLDHSLQIHPAYQESSIQAIHHLWENLEDSVIRYPEFRLLLDEYSELSAYSISAYNQKPDILNKEERREVWIPIQIKHLISQLVEMLRSNTTSYLTTDILDTIPAYIRSSSSQSVLPLAPLEERVEIVRKLTEQTLHDRDLNLAILTLYLMERSWLWYFGNQSRCMNFFNVLLKKIGFQPISHGITDFAAFSMDNFEDFRRYVLFVMSNIEEQQVK